MHLSRKAPAGVLAGYVHPAVTDARVSSCALIRSTGMRRSSCCVLLPPALTTSTWVASRLQYSTLPSTCQVISGLCEPVSALQACPKAWVGAVVILPHCHSDTRGRGLQTCSSTVANLVMQQSFSLIYIPEYSAKLSALDIILNSGQFCGHRFCGISHSSRRLTPSSQSRGFHSDACSRHLLRGQNES